ncbi:Metal-dependent phosphohydrolase [Candidatus Syntrophocurvum alkaliphilum]|uniref:Metal-dependent phosphohydrolase n=1 Tax=Candidatus Syntrophocurvum alkaliphilum TaxID=2293317 RepID=A0A6I6DJU0_9FIRM|nr:HD-GYP domain-containing protein [Candidatus Syntrophocurvum alkaliphilum]QGU00839.1 Metal-dependent phosphohydrolase [Candidatus Syntrophocurvum alkaliphilum]
MRRVFIDNLKPGMEVARRIYSSDSRILINAGIKLTEAYIQRLKQMGIASVYIIDEAFGDVENAPDVVSEQTRLKTAKIVKDGFNLIEQERKINIKSVQNTVNNIIDELLSNLNILVNLTDIRAFDDYTFGHSVNVCILSVMTAMTLGYNNLKLKELGMGALLHDIGKTQVDKSILTKNDDLTPEEFEEVKKHAEYGFKLLKNYDDISLLSAHIAYQHHERWDGNGYPRKLQGEEIHEYARIVGVADVYDALLSDRPYRPAYSIKQSIDVLNRMKGIYLDEKCVDALISNIAIYPLGSIVQLNTGDYGIVVDINKTTPSKPIIRVVYKNDGLKIANPHEVDLSKMTRILITRVLNEKEINQIKNLDD